MKNNIKILLILILLGCVSKGFANEKFLRIKGEVKDGLNADISGFDVKVVLDGLDSATTNFEKNDFDIWLPANRKANVFFMKAGYQTKLLHVDASFIPEFAYKKKQLIELNVKLEKGKSKPKIEPFCVANFKSSETKFILKYPSQKKQTKPTNFKPPFPAPVDTYAKARPSNKNLDITAEFNKEKAKKSSPYSVFLQGVLFADLNYCIFNERIEKANGLLSQLSDIDKNKWANIKPFDAPEYGTIVMRTVNREQSVDTLFALGCWIETSRLLLQSFTSDSKVIMHNKKLVNLFKNIKEPHLDESQKDVYTAIQNLVPVIKELEEKFLDHMRNKITFDMKMDETFIQLQTEINQQYQKIIS